MTVQARDVDILYIRTPIDSRHVRIEAVLVLGVHFLEYPGKITGFEPTIQERIWSIYFTEG